MRDLFAIYVTAMIGITKAVPVGIVLRVPPHYVFLMTVLGAYTSAVAIYLGHGWVATLLARHPDGDRMSKRRQRIFMLVSRYGVAGMGLLGTVFMGSNLTFLLGLTVVGRKKTLVVWIAVGITLWAAVLTGAAALGLEFVERAALFRVLTTRGR